MHLIVNATNLIYRRGRHCNISGPTVCYLIRSSKRLQVMYINAFIFYWGKL